MSFSAAGSLTGTATIAAPKVAALASAQIGTSSYVFSVSQDSNTLTSWTVAANGRLTAAHSLTPETGLWISAPTALTTAQVDGQTYVFLGSAGSDSRSVMAVGAGGTLTITDHLLDDRNNRFGGVAALDVETVGGHSYVISGGDDDGISVHLLLPGGQLLAQAEIADTTDMSLSNISTIAAQGDATCIEIFAASAIEDGLTRLRFEIGAQGVTLNPRPVARF
jgi:hypothetical protein